MHYGINYSTAKAIVKENKKLIQERSTRSDEEYIPGNSLIEIKCKEEPQNKGVECSYK